MDVSIIIVNWNSAAYVKTCLRSIYENVRGITFEVIVVDNASNDGCGEMIRNEFPEAKFVQSEENLGFARGNNLGYRNSSGKSLLFLNPDTEILGSAVNKLFGHLRSLKKAGIIGCRLLNSDLTIQLSSVQTPTSILKEFLASEHLMLRFPKLKLWGIRSLLFYRGHPEPVSAVSGACMMIDRSVFQSVGEFSEEYFMYAEDMDLCRKVKQAGYEVYHAGDAQIVHHSGKSSSSNERNEVMLRESTMKYLKKTKGAGYALAYKKSLTVDAILRLALIATLRLVSPEPSSKGRLHLLRRKWTAIFLWSLGAKR